MHINHVIEGEKVRLELFKETDVSETYLSWLANPKINRYLEVRFSKYTNEMAREYVRNSLDSPNHIFLKIVTLNGVFIGTCSILFREEHTTSELGLMLGDERFHGLGIGTEVISLLTFFCSKSLGVRKITAGLYASNTASLGAFLKNGFHVESVFKSQALLDGVPEDVYRLAYFTSSVDRA